MRVLKKTAKRLEVDHTNFEFPEIPQKAKIEETTEAEEKEETVTGSAESPDSKIEETTDNSSAAEDADTEDVEEDNRTITLESMTGSSPDDLGEVFDSFEVVKNASRLESVWHFIFTAHQVIDAS